jgi:alpha-beta hydrolase superfamily lysophospholipase
MRNSRAHPHIAGTQQALAAGDMDALPFGFDWRLDVDGSSLALAERIGSWASGEPVLVVAHSMGGLVARRMSQLETDMWRSRFDRAVARRVGSSKYGCDRRVPRWQPARASLSALA